MKLRLLIACTLAAGIGLGLALVRESPHPTPLSQQTISTGFISEADSQAPASKADTTKLAALRERLDQDKEISGAVLSVTVSLTPTGRTALIQKIKAQGGKSSK